MTYLTSSQWHDVLMRYRKACQRITMRTGRLTRAQWRVLDRITTLHDATLIDDKPRNRAGEVEAEIGTITPGRLLPLIEYVYYELTGIKPDAMDCDALEGIENDYGRDVAMLALQVSVERGEYSPRAIRWRAEEFVRYPDEYEDYVAATKPTAPVKIHKMNDNPQHMYDYLACRTPKHVPGECPECLGEGVVSGRKLTGRGLNAWHDAPEYEYVPCDVCNGMGLDDSDDT